MLNEFLIKLRELMREYDAELTILPPCCMHCGDMREVYEDPYEIQIRCGGSTMSVETINNTSFKSIETDEVAELQGMITDLKTELKLLKQQHCNHECSPEG